MLWPLRSFLLGFGVAIAASSAANGADPITEMIAATFKITHKDSTSTCFVMARPGDSDASQTELILVTTAHTLARMSGDECRLVLRAKQADGGFVRKEVPLQIRSAKKPLWVRHPDVDVAALKLQLPADASISALDFDQLASESAITSGKLRTADEVWIPCYPAQLEANGAGFPVLRRGTVASFPLAPIQRDKTYLVDFSTFAGDSGAPVMIGSREVAGNKQQRPLVVGLVTGQHRETTRSTTPIEERTVHRSLGLAIVIHAEFIRQTIDRLPR